MAKYFVKMKMKVLKVAKKQAQEIIAKLKEEHNLDNNYKIKRDLKVYLYLSLRLQATLKNTKLKKN